MSVQDHATKLEQLMGWQEGSVGVRAGEDRLILVRDGHARELIERIERNDRSSDIVTAVRELFGVAP